MSSFVLVLIGLAISWWWIARARVTTHPVAMMPTRIAFPGGIHVHDREHALAQLDRPEEIVVPFEHAILLIEYPLTTPASIPIEAPLHHGFTRSELVKAVCEQYANVYEAEEATATQKTVPPEERGKLRNRNRTDGVYGIWGHDLADLVLTSARWTRKPDGTVLIELHVES